MKHPHPQPPPQPGFYALIGPNAAGKTHLLRSLMGPGAAFVPAGADAKFAGDTVARQLRAANAAKPLAPVDMPDARIKDLSVGQRRLLTIRIALAAQEPLLLLDEPFDGIDATTRKQVRQQLIDYIAEDPERTIIMASHRAEDFAGLATHVIQVFDREVHSSGLPLESVRTHFPTITGPTAEIEGLTTQYPVAETATLGPTARATFTDPAAAATTHLPVNYPTDAELFDLLATTPIHVEPEETDQTTQGDVKR
ncbi:ABC transporter ATP-binding protein [Corynebacterium sp. MSK044]|uniref:ATP-binding cassette domain-containing protein n=1 Tax=Corynebacterium sp. MSK044 TaxID=3050195 RepID=UPI00254DAD9E|nr:ABC transporter ATP-binding protein [Corynebacterium sp. MSK044]MDK8797115.1 ABC transporter ATP-binding protein [Corynebacterium sp. MSK044]